MKGEHFGGFEKSGKAHEMSLLGDVRKDDPEYEKTLRKLGADQRGYLPFYVAKELAMQFQPLVRSENRFTHDMEVKLQDPANPDKGFPKDLLEAIKDQLGFISDEDLSRLKYYTAVGSPLDYFHGVDAFIILEGKTKQDPEALVTFDVALKNGASEKQDARADIIIKEPEPPVDPESTRVYLRQVDDLAAQAVKFFQNPRK